MFKVDILGKIASWKITGIKILKNESMFSPKTLKFIFTERSNERCLPKTDIQWQNGFNRGFVCASIFGTDEIFIGQTRRQVESC